MPDALSKNAPSPLGASLSFVFAMSVLSFLILSFWLQNTPYWLDEVTSLAYTQEDWVSLLGPNWSSDAHRPYYYGVQKIWNSFFGTDRYTVRLLNVVFGVLSVPLFFLIARRLGGNTVAVISTICFVLSPLFVFQSREVRMYPLLNLSVLAGTLAFLLLIEAYKKSKDAGQNGGNLTLWLSFTIAALSAFYAHSTGIIFPILCGIIVIATIAMGITRLVFLRDLLLASLVFSFLAIPAILPLVTHVGTTLDDFWIPELSLSHVYSQLAGAYPYPMWGKPIIAGLIIFGFWVSARNPVALLVLTVFIIGQPLLMILISAFKPILIVRAMVWPTLFASIAVGFALTHFRPVIRMPFIGLVLTLQVMTVRPLYFEQPQFNEIGQLREQLATINPEEQQFVLGLQQFEYFIRWNHPELIDSRTLAVSYADGRQLFDALNWSTFTARSELEGRVSSDRELWLIQEREPLFPIPPEDDVKPALAAIAEGRVLLQEHVAGNAILRHYSAK